MKQTHETELTPKQEAEQAEQENERRDRRNTIVGLSILASMLCFAAGSKVGQMAGYEQGKEAAQIKTLIVGNSSGSNSPSNYVAFTQNDGTCGFFEYSPKTDYIVNSRSDMTIVESTQPAWARTTSESNLVENAIKQATRKTYKDFNAETNQNNYTESRINHYTGKGKAF